MLKESATRHRQKQYGGATGYAHGVSEPTITHCFGAVLTIRLDIRITTLEQSRYLGKPELGLVQHHAFSAPDTSSIASRGTTHCHLSC
jgi:hypothetical protein